MLGHAPLSRPHRTYHHHHNNSDKTSTTAAQRLRLQYCLGSAAMIPSSFLTMMSKCDPRSSVLLPRSLCCKGSEDVPSGSCLCNYHGMNLLLLLSSGPLAFISQPTKSLNLKTETATSTWKETNLPAPLRARAKAPH